MEPEDLEADERTTLLQRLDLHRSAVAAALDDLTEEQARRRLVASRTTVLGLVKHLTFVERVWFTETLVDRPRTTLGLPADAQESFELADDDTIASVRAGYLAAVAEAREHLTAFALDDVVTGNLRRPRVSVRWVLVHCVSEVAQHCGHLDILREQLLAEEAD
jgi:uncharacterized damage-inducible protein DinB